MDFRPPVAARASIARISCRAADEIERGQLHVPPSERDHAEQVAPAVAHLAQLRHAQGQRRPQANNLHMLAS